MARNPKDESAAPRQHGPRELEPPRAGRRDDHHPPLQWFQGLGYRDGERAIVLRRPRTCLRHQIKEYGWIFPRSGLATGLLTRIHVLASKKLKQRPKKVCSGLRESKSAANPDAATQAELADANKEYEQKFGRIFIVCATGKTAAEMLTILRKRLANDPATELKEAAEQQRQITQLRLRKWLGTS